MGKRIRFMMVCVFLFTCTMYLVGAAPTVSRDKDTIFHVGEGTGEIEMDNSGNITAEGIITAEGLSITDDATVTDVLTVSGSLNVTATDMRMNVHEAWEDIATAADLTAPYATTKSTAQFGTKIGVTITQPTVGRNVIVKISSAVPASATLAGSTVITGTTTAGVAVTETFTSSQTMTSNYAYVWISSVTVTITACSVVTVMDDTSGEYMVALELESGVKIGLSNNIEASADVYGLFENDVAIADDLATISATYDTITFSNAPDGSKDYKVYYKASPDQY